MNQILNSDEELNKKLFLVLAWTAIIANTIGYLSNAFLYGITRETLFTFACALVMYMAGAWGMVSGKRKVPIMIIMGVCNCIEFPGMYLMYGPDRLGYMFLGLVGIVLFLKNKWRTLAAEVTILLDGGVILWRALNPDAFYIIPEGDNLVAAWVDYIIASISIIVLIIILLRQYDAQRQKLQELTEELQEMAHLDPLTQLYNRRFLTEYLDDKIRNGNAEFAVALLDIDDFKAINDNYGHVYGDETLQAFANSMKSAIQGQGIAARFGGEEFMLVFNHSDQEKMERVLKQVEETFAGFGMDTRQISLSFSGGVEIFHNEDRITKLFNAADEKLYHAKHLGKHKVIFEN